MSYDLKIPVRCVPALCASSNCHLNLSVRGRIELQVLVDVHPCEKYLSYSGLWILDTPYC